jgi:hypothetical protein
MRNANLQEVLPPVEPASSELQLTASAEARASPGWGEGVRAPRGEGLPERDGRERPDAAGRGAANGRKLLLRLRGKVSCCH